jgi:hypothetical protein
MTHGNPETFEHTRYIQISGKAWPAILEAARNMAGSYDFPKQPTLKDLFNGANAEELINDYMARMQHVFNVEDPTPEQVEEFKEKRQECNEPVKWKPLADLVPKGFVVLTKSKYHDSVAFRVDDILQIEEFFGEDVKIVTKIFPDIRVKETFEEVLEEIKKALEV